MQPGYYLVGFILATIYLSCAVKATPQGGPRDESPPAIILETSTPNKQTNFTGRSFTISLDEWVKLEDAQTQVLVSPPLEKRPEIKTKGRSVVFTFHDDEILRENTTYTINFGNSIQDITENNPLANHTFVFSTGDVIDSLTVSGFVFDAYSGEPVPESTIMVYENLADTIPFTAKPLYATRSAEETGAFTIGNMKAGTFRVLAVKDDNLNYLYDADIEVMGFLDSFLVLPQDNDEPLTLKVSPPEEVLYADRADTSSWNKAVIEYNRIPHELQIDYENPDGSLVYDIHENVISIWYHDDTRRDWPLYLNTGDEIDTMILKYNSSTDKFEKIKEQKRMANSGHPNDPAFICFDRPVQSFDTTYFELLEGNAKAKVSTLPIISDSLPMCLQLDYTWQPDSIYALTIFPGGITDFYGQANDTISQNFPIGNSERFGNIILNISELDSLLSYIVMLGLKDKPEVSFTIEATETFSKTIEQLRPATYELRITEDKNKNGRWDPGNLFLNNQPEVTTVKELEPLRANWDLEVDYKWNN